MLIYFIIRVCGWTPHICDEEEKEIIFTFHVCICPALLGEMAELVLLLDMDDDILSFTYSSMIHCFLSTTIGPQEQIEVMFKRTK